MVAEPTVLNRSLWLILTGFSAMLLTGFWLFPFLAREPFFNDMGWERLNDVGPPLLTVPMKIALPVAAIGVVTAYATRERIGIVFAATATILAAAVANLGEGPLWNARLLPFYYLSVYVLAAVGLALMVRFVGSSLSGALDRPDQRVMIAAPVAALLATLVAVSMPLRILPAGAVSAEGDGSYDWLVFTNSAGSFIPGWAEWNYSGYERKNSYAEYANVVAVMDGIGADGDGCGRAMWEYDKSLDRYGTPMALMLLPHWTDGCIGSMEGLYFESSATTPFHFLNQSTLSEAPSRAQRDLPYQGFDIQRGIAQLQVMGVRYYLAQSDTAIAAAREHPDLTELAEAQPFVVFEVAGSELVEGLAVEPVVTAGRTAEQVLIDLDDATGTEADVSRFDTGWVSQAVDFYNDPAGFRAIPAEDGPAGWERRETLIATDGRELVPATVSGIEVDNDRIAFTVDQVGSPVLVKASYFPNWRVDGAEGPWRAGPNLMVVVPTEESVTLSYGRTLVDFGGMALALVGVLAVLGLALLDRRRPSLAERLRLAEAHGRPVREALDPEATVGQLPWPAFEHLDSDPAAEPTGADADLDPDLPEEGPASPTPSARPSPPPRRDRAPSLLDDFGPGTAGTDEPRRVRDDPGLDDSGPDDSGHERPGRGDPGLDDPPIEA